jgi:hypothetical protein
MHVYLFSMPSLPGCSVVKMRACLLQLAKGPAVAPDEAGGHRKATTVQ